MNRFFATVMGALGLVTTSCTQNNGIRSVNAEEFEKEISGGSVQLVDVRTAEEYASGCISNARNIDVSQSDFRQKAVAALGKKEPVYVYCRSGHRSMSAAKVLSAAGYKVVNLEGGIMAWAAAGKVVAQHDRFVTKSGKAVDIFCVKHGSLRINFAGKEIEIDPVEAYAPATDYRKYPKADVILVTHEHSDHLDAQAIEHLTKDGMRLITNANVNKILGKGEVMRNGDTLRLADDITLEAVPAYNYSEEKLQFHPRGRDNGFILQLDDFRIYIAGDTEDIPEMAAVKDIDVAFLPCNLPYTMTPEQCAHAAKVVKPLVLFPYHYGKTDVKRLPELLEGTGIDVRIRNYQ